MDAFALHITVHFIPAPVPTALALFLLALAAYGLVMSERSARRRDRPYRRGPDHHRGGPFAAAVPISVQGLRSDPRLAYHHQTR